MSAQAQGTLVPSIPLVTIDSGKPTTTSNVIAVTFGKQHKDVLRAVKNLECTPEFTERNFAPSTYTDPTGRDLPCFRVSKDGFMILAMGFTGKEAMKWKEQFIDAFNAMEQELHQTAKATQTKVLGDALTYGRFFMTVERGHIRLDPIPDQAVLVADPEQFAAYVKEPTTVPLHALPGIIEAASQRLKEVYGKKRH